ncbi:Peptidyl-prolyl cis-trans isomerase F, mitochondrial [Chionoecetes opilio]|uniref:Peptidyl-prolyl cis-trans isomerase F, mitochondrial n=1 Tax=Chionoecetes opilio TaxID=41210 RepID=A0A8J4Y7P1_CHIOP|nr:Peptidyl-prolyl cis-trans isomerase F, mitochondrial [Chionoecetes opilio]
MWSGLQLRWSVEASRHYLGSPSGRAKLGQQLFETSSRRNGMSGKDFLTSPRGDSSPRGILGGRRWRRQPWKPRHRPGSPADSGCWWGGAAGHASLPAAVASSIRDRVKCPAVTNPFRSSLHPAPQSLQVEDLRRLTQHARDLLQRGLVFAVHTTAGRSRQASLSLEDDRLYLHCLRDQPLPRGAVTLQLANTGGKWSLLVLQLGFPAPVAATTRAIAWRVCVCIPAVYTESLALEVDEVVAAAPPCRVFLVLGWKGRPSRRVLIHLGTDTPGARQFLLLCTGQRGPSYNGSTLFKVVNEGGLGECVMGGDYENNNGEGGAALLPDLDEGVYRESCMAGGVLGWWCGDPAQDAQFCIITKDWLEGSIVPYVIGKVEVGLEVVQEAARHRPITEVTVVDCGVVVD